MTKCALTLGAILAVTAATSSTGWAKPHSGKVALLPASGINIHPGYLEASQDVLRGHLLDTGNFQVVVLPGPPGTEEPTPAEATSRARAVGAKLALVLHITRLGATARVRLTAYDVATGRAVYRDELPAGSPDDLDPVLERLAKGLATGQSAKDTADINTVTEDESDPLLKRAATNVFGVKLGFVAPQNSPGGNGQAFIPGGDVFWLYDVRTFLAEVDVGFHDKSGDGDFGISLGSYYPLSRQNVTPYIGGGLQWKIVSDYGGNGASGIAVFGSVGVLIGRLSTVQLRADLSYFLNTFTEDPAPATGTGPATGAGTPTHEHGPILSVGIGF